MATWAIDFMRWLLRQRKREEEESCNAGPEHNIPIEEMREILHDNEADKTGPM